MEQLHHKWLNHHLYTIHKNSQMFFLFLKNLENQKKTFRSWSVFVPVIVGPSVEQL